MNEDITLILNGFYNLTNLEKLKVVEEINNYFDSNDREPIRNENNARFQKIDVNAEVWKCKCCGK